MITENLLKKYNFCNITSRSFNINGYDLKYMCCQKSYSCKNTNCELCSDCYSRYIIIDLSNNNTLSIINNTILSSFNAFQDFQNEKLSKIFFYENKFIRYNIYLIFIYQDYLPLYDQVSKDLNFARKFFFTEEDFCSYFDFFIDINKVAHKNIENDKFVVDSMKKLVQDLHSEKKLSILTDKTEFKFFIDTFSQKSYDDYIGLKTSPNLFFKEYIYKNTSPSNIKNFQDIKSIELKNFRTDCFNESEKIDVGRINVIFGNNAIGKSSILDAIEFAITGETHKNPNDPKIMEAEATIIDTENNYISSDFSTKNSEALKSKWYSNKIGTLNELFCRINYFDTDATYRFALEEGDIDDAFNHLKKLICNAKLIEFQNNISTNKHQCQLFREYIRYREPKYKIKKNSTESFKEKIIKYIFRKSDIYYANKQDYYYDINKKQKMAEEKITAHISICDEAAKRIETLINSQISLSIELITRIFKKLYSYDCRIEWENDSFVLHDDKSGKINNIKTMSTAQKVCLALSVIFSQFFVSKDAPRIILLDESVANFDSYHLLNLLDFLREAALYGIQIFFTTANEEVAKIAKNKFSFINDQFYLYKIDRDEQFKTHIVRITNK